MTLQTTFQSATVGQREAVIFEYLRRISYCYMVHPKQHSIKKSRLRDITVKCMLMNLTVDRRKWKHNKSNYLRHNCVHMSVTGNRSKMFRVFVQGFMVTM